MKMYVLSATLDKMTTTQGIQARDDFSAKVLAVHKINANHIADKRYAKGEIVLKDPEGKAIWNLPVETELKKKIGV